MIGYLKIRIIAFGNHFVKAKYRFMVFSIYNMLDSSFASRYDSGVSKICMIFATEIQKLICIHNISYMKWIFHQINSRTSISYMIHFRCFDHIHVQKITQFWLTIFFKHS